MAATLLQSQSELAKTLIKKAFIQLYSKQGIDKITVREICAVSGVSRPAFYRHFDDKYDILEQIETELLTNLKQLNSKYNKFFLTEKDRILPNFAETTQYIYDNREYFIPLITIPGDSRFIHRWKLIMQEDFFHRLTCDNVLPKENAEILTFSMSSSLIGMFEYWLTKETELSPEELALIGTKLLFHSFYHTTI